MLLITKVRPFSLLLLLLLAASWALAQGTPSSTAPQLFWNGYVQGRYSDNFGSGAGNGNFEVRRAFLNLRAVVNPKVSATILFSFIPSTSVCEAFGEYRFSPEISAKAGMVRIPFGYEVPLTSSRLLTLERSQVTGNLLARDFTFERGLFAYYSPKDTKFSLAAAIVNGSFTANSLPLSADNLKRAGANDPNDNKNFVSRLAYSMPDGQVGASVYTGTHPLTNEFISRCGMDLNWSKNGITVIGEVLQGRGNYIPDPASAGNLTWSPTIDSRGGYLTAGYQLPKSKFQPYLRYDCFDSDRDAANTGYERFTVGFNYLEDKNTRVTLEYQAINDDAKPNMNGSIAAQYQVGF